MCIPFRNLVTYCLGRTVCVLTFNTSLKYMRASTQLHRTSNEFTTDDSLIMYSIITLSYTVATVFSVKYYTQSAILAMSPTPK